MNKMWYCIDYQYDKKGRGLLYCGPDEDLAQKLYVTLSIALPKRDLQLRELQSNCDFYGRSMILPFSKMRDMLPDFKWDILIEQEKIFLQAVMTN